MMSSAALGFRGIRLARWPRIFGHDDTLSGRDVYVPVKQTADEEAEERVVQFGESHASWITAVVDRMNRLTTLPEDWDSGGGVPVERDAAEQALLFLRTVTAPSTLQPSIVPAHDGSLALEWHTPIYSLEVDIAASGHASGYFRDRDHDSEWEDESPGLPERVRRTLEMRFEVQ